MSQFVASRAGSMIGPLAVKQYTNAELLSFVLGEQTAINLLAQSGGYLTALFAGARKLSPVASHVCSAQSQTAYAGTPAFTLSAAW